MNHYFPDKRVLFESAIKLVRAQYQELVVQELMKYESPTEKLRAYVRTAMSWIKVSRTDAKSWSFFFYLCASDSNLRTLHRELTSMGMERLKALLHAVALENKLPATNLDEKAKNIQRLITGALFEFATEYEPRDMRAYDEIAEQTVNLCLHICR